MTNPDQNIPAGLTPEDAKKAREWALHALNKPGASTTAEKAVARVVIGTVPEPRPTLADMFPEERAACKWMQCDVTGYQEKWVIATPYSGDGDAVVISPDGDMGWISTDLVTPRPDLPRMKWPGTEKAAPDPALPDGWRLADHEVYGRVIVTTSIPNHDGRVYFVFPSARDSLGYGGAYCTPDELTYLDGDQ